MKRSLVGIMLVVAMVMSGCAGARAQRNVLAPALLGAWTVISVQAADGGATAEQVADFAEALDTWNKIDVVAQWPVIRAAAEMSIHARLAAGEIGPGVAESLRSRLRQFTEAVDLLQESGLFR